MHIHQILYASKYPNRKLSWLHNRSIGEIIGSGYSNFKCRYIFKVSTLQLKILLLYYTKDRYNVGEILQATKLKPEVLHQILQILFKAEVLLCSGAGKELEEEMCQIKKEQVKTIHEIENERKFIIQAAIVRVMKMRKEIQHSLLVAEVIDQLSHQFKPNIQAIKKNIEILIEKEYIQRSESERDIYLYLLDIIQYFLTLILLFDASVKCLKSKRAINLCKFLYAA